MKEQVLIKGAEVQEMLVRVTGLLYQEKKHDNYIIIEQFLEQLLELYDLIIQALQKGEKISFDEVQFQKMLLEATNAIQDRDLVLLADIFQYDLQEQLKVWLT